MDFGAPDMRVVHINTQGVEGGAATMAMSLVLEQRRCGHEVFLLAGRKVGRSGQTGDLSIWFDPKPDDNLRYFCEAAKLPYFHFQGSHALPDHPLIRLADVVHVHNIHFDYFNPLSLSFLSHAKPTVWTLHDLYPVTGMCMHPGHCPSWKSGCFPCYRDQLNDPHQHLGEGNGGKQPFWGTFISLQWKKMLYEHCHLRIVCPSHWMRRQVQGSILSKSRIDTVHNGVDTATFRPLDKVEARRRLGLCQNAPVIGAMAVHGALDNPLKGGNVLKEVMTILTLTYPDILLLNVGCDKEETTPHIRNIPYVYAQEELAWIYAAMDVFVHAAVEESFCLVAIEALSCGVPVVAFDTGPLPELIRHGQTGLLCPSSDATALADSVHMILKSPTLQKNFGHNARERVTEMFSFAQTNEAYMRIYTTEVEARQVSPPPIKPFDLDTLPALLKTPDFLCAEGKKIGKNLAASVIQESLVEAFLNQVPQVVRDQLAPLHHKDMRIRQVFALRRQGKLVDSLRVLDQLIAQWPEDMTLMRTKGVTLGLLDKDDEAIAAFHQCLAADPPQTDVWLNMFDIFMRRGRLKECQEALDTFAKIDPLLKGFNHRLGLLRQQQGRQREAIRAFLTELRLHGSHESVQHLRVAWKKRLQFN